MFLADKHNFGQQVEKIQRGFDIWYQKPRSVYWEWLFFGKTSPLKNLFNVKGKNGIRPIADYFFNLDVEIESKWSGSAKEIPTEVQKPTLEHFYSFGTLIAYCYIFGIRDLHKQNLIMTKTHLQAVDIEVVFTEILLPHETLLFPFKTIGYEFAGIGALINSKNELTKTQIEQVILGYWDLFDLITIRKVEIEKVLTELDFSEVPIRVIVRNTSEYKTLLDNSLNNILPSEIEQLNRGDIPFYFKFVGNKNLYWLKTKELSQAEESPLEFQKDIDRHGKYESTEWIKTRSSNQTLVQGLFYIIKYFGIDLNLELSQQAKVENRSIKIGSQIFKF